MKILLTGRNGQVGWELERSLAPLGEVVATDQTTLDLADPDAIRRAVRETRPDAIVNAGAYTAVDRAESEPELAMRINGVAPGILADEAKRHGALLVHYSTDYVFDGTKRTPYAEEDEPNPINVYGRTKLAGERAVAAVGGRHLILRTSWVYGLRGRNFLLAILHRARKGEPLRVVDDQRGAPTWCREIAAATARILAERPGVGHGVFNLTAAGEATWREFAQAIVESAGIEMQVQAITTADYPTPAARPRYSVLGSAKRERELGIRMASWDAALAQCMAAHTGIAPGDAASQA